MRISDALSVGRCCKLLDSLVKTDTFWLRRIQLDFNVRVQCDNLRCAKNFYVLMHDVWDSDRGEFDLK